MDEEIRERIRRLRAFSESAKRRAGLYADVAGMDDRGTARSLGALQRAPAAGGQAAKGGLYMLWIPEPTGVTVAVGGPMILAGRYLDKKYNGATIGDVGRQARSNASDMERIRSSLMRD
ncbi:hypothetical protein CENSYa_1200 [Cenarchaeum symbiosum A]|uniref:Uncharacterized protein n=1 Tax=Cenarchaeum symbiosum (strain A) TaxID=414004 RepID=A0RWV7_CENSY|nr:hypothetical protein CENSYa_1200 [Cenarchaeum symbiosum A]